MQIPVRFFYSVFVDTLTSNKKLMGILLMQYLISVFQVSHNFKQKNKRSLCCVIPWGWALPNLGLYSALPQGSLFW